MSKYKIGYQDDKAGAQVSLYQKLYNDFDVFIFELQPGFMIDQVVSTIKNEKIDLMIIDYKLDDTGIVTFKGNDVLKCIQKWNPYYPLIIITSYQDEAIRSSDNISLINDKSIIDNKDLFILRLHSMIERFYEKQEDAKSTIKKLAIKKNREGLSPAEEEEYYNLYRFLNDSSPEEKILPSDFLTPAKVSEIHDLLKTAKEILKQVKGEKS
jgi:DNA-binding NtrC family response regulator